MLRTLRNLALLGAAMTAMAACADPQQPTDPQTGTATRSGTAIQPATPRTLNYTTFTCDNVTKQQALDSLNKLTPQLFKGGANGRRGRVVNLINDMSRTSDPAVAAAYADTLINITLQDYYAGDLVNQNNDLAGTQQRVVSFITYLYCYNNLSPLPDFDQLFNGYSKFIRYETPTTTVYDNPNQRFAGVQIQQNQVPNFYNNAPFYGTLVTVIRTTDLLPTDLDWYGLGTSTADGYKKNAFRFTTDPEVDFTSPVLTGVCVDIDTTLVDPKDLRVAHGYSDSTPSGPGNVIVGNIEILAPQSVTPLQLDATCTPQSLAAATFLGRAGQLLARMLLPSDLLAAGTTTKVGTSGSTSSFSPFGAVDTKLAATGSGPSSPVYIPLGSTTTTAPVSVTVKSRRGQLAQSSVGISFAPSTSFSPASASTNGSGVAGSTWTLVAGSNTGSAAPTSSLFKFASAVTFSVNTVQETTLDFDAGNALKDGTAGVAYLDTLKATGGVGTYGWSATGLPTNLTIDTLTGIISGTPQSAGAYTVNVTVKSNQQQKTTSYPLTIKLPAITITTTSLAPASYGVPYSQTLQATGGDPSSRTWSLSLGSLPQGLALSSSGVISGTPTSSAATSNFTVLVTSGTGAGQVQDDQALTITVGYPSSLSLAFQPGPIKNQCYARGQSMGTIKVYVSSGGKAVAGVPVTMEAILNNGSKLTVTPPTATSGADGIADFTGMTISQTGTVVLRAVTRAPWPVSSVQTNFKFNISPSC